MLLSYSTDRLIPPEDLKWFSSGLSQNGDVVNHYEGLESEYANDPFLIENKTPEMNLRLTVLL